MRTQTYPSGHTVNYNYDASGRLADKDGTDPAFSGNLGDGVGRTYASEFEYTALGGVQQEKFGTDTALYHKQRFNQRVEGSQQRDYRERPSSRHHKGQRTR